MTASGFDTAFLTDHVLSLPVPATRLVSADIQTTIDNEAVRHCTHFSLSMSASRKLCRWVAWNIDASVHRTTTSDARHFVGDRAYLPAQQLGAKLYRHDDFDQGHIAAFSDVSWGPVQEAAEARRESCFYSNITPQLDSFNRSSMKGVWGGLEAEITQENDVDGKRLSVFGGPIFAADDPAFKGTHIPRQYWKVVAYVERGALKCKGFILTQPPLESHLEDLVLNDFQIYQRRIADLSHTLSLAFGPLPAADTAPAPARNAEGLLASAAPVSRRIDSLADVNAQGW